MAKMDDPVVVEHATDARQGRTGRPVLIVLVCGLVLVLLAWAAAEWWGESTDNSASDPATRTTTQSATVHSTAPSTTQGNTAPTDNTSRSPSGTGGPVPPTNNAGSTNKQP
jgi:hypothetical protein